MFSFFNARNLAQRLQCVVTAVQFDSKTVRRMSIIMR